jgi:glycine/D-amino acid oxidase-like deaminating enzyme
MELTRRDFLESVFGMPLAALLLESGCRAAQPPTRELPGALLGQSAESGHLLRGDTRERIAHVAALAPTHTEVAIVGGGPAGLSAAYALRKGGLRELVVLELEPEPGGTSRAGRSQVTAYPWGAHYLPVPQRHNVALVNLLQEMGVVTGEDARGELTISEPHLVRAPEERLFYKGYWYPGLYLDAGATTRDLAERARFEQLVARWADYRDAQGRRAFTIPLSLASDAPEVRALDALSAPQLLAREGFRSTRLMWLLDYACRDDYGLSLRDASAWALLFYFAARLARGGAQTSELITWPEGNQALVRHLASGVTDALCPSNIVLDVHEREGAVELLCWDVARDRGVRYVAEHAVIATPQFIADRIVRTRRAEPLESRPYAPWLVANLHLRERPLAHGAPLAWDNVIYDSPSLGYVCATHQRGSDFGETVFTYYLPLTDSDPRRARQKLYDGDLSSWRAAVLLDLGRAHPNLAQLVTHLDVFRWGHAMVRPEVGAQFSPARSNARRTLGRIHFAHSDLSGVSLFEEAFDHGLRAAREVLTRARPDGAPVRP